MFIGLGVINIVKILFCASVYLEGNYEPYSEHNI